MAANSLFGSLFGKKPKLARPKSRELNLGQLSSTPPNQPSQPKPSQKKSTKDMKLPFAKLNSAFASILALAIGLIASVMAYQYLSANYQRVTGTFFKEAARVKTVDVQNALALVEEAVFGLQSHLQTAPDPSASFDEQAARLVARHETMYAIAWVEAVKSADLSKPVMYRQLSASTTSSMPIMQRSVANTFVPAEPKADYLVLTRVQVRDKTKESAKESAETIKKFIGLDFSSDDNWAAAIASAKQRGAVEISYQGFGIGDSLLIQAISDKATGDIKGYLVVSISLAKMIQSDVATSAAPASVDRIFDASDKSGLKQLFPNLITVSEEAVNINSEELSQRRELLQRLPITAFNRSWLVEIEPTITGLRSHASRVPEFVAGLGALVTMLIAGYLFAVRNRTAKIENIVTQRTAQLEDAFFQVREAELVAMQSEKMSSIGQMVAGVAHEINTPLGFVNSNLEMMSDGTAKISKVIEQQEALMADIPRWAGMPQEERQQWYQNALKGSKDLAELRRRRTLEETQELVSETMVGLERISEIVLSLKDFSRVDRSQTDDVDIHQCIDSTLIIAQNVTKDKAEIVKQYGAIPTIPCSPSQVNQIILNLISNAAQAMNEFGRITISTRVDAGFIAIDIADNGAGMSEATKTKIFEPFFSTKAAGEGTGLGLAICTKIAKAHNGTLTVESELGKGTTFTLRLPIKSSEIANGEALLVS